MAYHLGDAARWIIAPDIVGGGVESLKMSVTWRKTWKRCPVLIAVQDGMNPRDVYPHLNKETGIAIGGTTEFKRKMLPIWSSLAGSVGCYLHCLRVNTRRRMVACNLAGVDSIDGTSATIYSVNAPKIRRWMEEINRQGTLEFWR